MRVGQSSYCLKYQWLYKSNYAIRFRNVPTCKLTFKLHTALTKHHSSQPTEFFSLFFFVTELKCCWIHDKMSAVRIPQRIWWFRSPRITHLWIHTEIGLSWCSTLHDWCMQLEADVVSNIKYKINQAWCTYFSQSVKTWNVTWKWEKLPYSPCQPQQPIYPFPGFVSCLNPMIVTSHALLHLQLREGEK